MFTYNSLLIQRHLKQGNCFLIKVTNTLLFNFEKVINRSSDRSFTKKSNMGFKIKFFKEIFKIICCEKLGDIERRKIN